MCDYPPVESKNGTDFQLRRGAYKGFAQAFELGVCEKTAARF
jgi:hypothetical protein